MNHDVNNTIEKLYSIFINLKIGNFEKVMSYYIKMPDSGKNRVPSSITTWIEEFDLLNKNIENKCINGTLNDLDFHLKKKLDFGKNLNKEDKDKALMELNNEINAIIQAEVKMKGATNV